MRIWTLWRRQENGEIWLISAEEDKDMFVATTQDERLCAIDIPDDTVEELFAERAVEGKVVRE